jgi:hypothetical protein
MQTMLQDFRNALTHELGHLIGLDHNCCVSCGLDRPWPVDEHGANAPECGSASPTEKEATMFNSACSGDVSKRSLAQDDIDAVCGLYPVDKDPMECHPVDLHKGCAAGPGAAARERSAAGAIAIAAAVALGAGRRRRERRRAR